MKSVFSACAIVTLSVSAMYGQTGLQVSYGNKGVSRLAYNGTVLVDTVANPADQFHIWHMKSTDLAGNVLSAGQYGWGENNLGTTWDATSNTETYRFSWGSIVTQFVQQGDRLNLVVTEINNPGSGILFDGAEIDALALHFPQMPAGFYGYSQYAITTTGPGVSIADYGSGRVTSVVPDESAPLYGGWKSAGGTTYTPLMVSTSPDGLASFLPHNDRPVQPGSSFTYTVSLRFTPEGTAADASDAYMSFAATYPSQMTWSDKRIIGTAYLASSPSNPNITQSGGFPSNPRRYFNDPSVDITTDAGMRSFQARVLAQAAENVATARGLNSQGVITWDVEGEQYPQSTSYVCSPEQIASVAPEMELPVLNSNSAYFGLPLDTAYFKTMTDAGLRTGVCLRPQKFALGGNGTASQSFLSGNAAIIANLETKAAFANTRWGATLFYVDSTVDATGGTLDPAIFQQLITDMPGFLFIPEESTPRYYAYSAPFYSFLFHTDIGTPSSILQAYPHAFGANLVNDVSAATLATYTPQLTAQVRQGDILMGHADFWQANDPTLVSIYTAAGVNAPTPAPVQATPVISWPNPANIVYGTPLSGTQLNASSNVAGTFRYAPAAGAVLGAGRNTLAVTFTPNDTASYKSVSATATQVVTQASPVLSWNAPAAITAGTTLSGAQLNATASVPGSFLYSPNAGTAFAAGTYTLKAVFTPTDAVDYTPQTATTVLTVNTAAPIIPAPVIPAPVPTPAPANVNLAILSPTNGAFVSGRIQVAGLVNLFLDSAGTFLIVDGQEVGTHRVLNAPWLYPLDTTTLSNGPHLLQLWGHDIGNNTTLSATIQVTVSN